MLQVDRERAEDEAAEWLILLAEEPENAALQSRFDAWHAAHPLNAEIWARTGRAYELIGPAARKPALHAMPHPAPLRRRPVMRAAMLALAAAILIALSPVILLRVQADERTAAAETRMLTLADGSQLYLAPESAVSVDVSGRQRRIRILQGRAWFDVTPDAARPFTVQAGDTLVTVVGTAFDVRRQDNGAAVSVSRGRVQVENAKRPADGAALLNAGDALVMTGTQVERRQVDPDDVAGWRTGRLTLRDASIAEVIDELRPYFSGFILVADDAFGRQRVSGVYDLNDPLRTLRGLAASHNGQLRQITPWVIQLHK